MLTGQTITSEQVADIQRRHKMIRDWMVAHKTNSYKAEDLSSELGIALPTNEETSAAEVFEFLHNPPQRYFLYISQRSQKSCKGERTVSGLATTWTGEPLGDVGFGQEFRDNFGGRRIPINVYAINGKTYSGTYYKSAGDYARVKMCKG